MTTSDAHRLNYEADNAGLARHLADEHQVMTPPHLATALSAGAWEELDRVHVAAHEPVDPLVVDAVAWALFAGDDADYLAGAHQPTDDEQHLAALLVRSLRLRGYDVTALQ